MSVCASVQLEMHRPENMNKITDVRALTCTTFHLIFYLTFTASLYDGRYECFHMGVVRSISRLIHGIAREMGASNQEGVLGSRHLYMYPFVCLCDMVR